MLKCFLLLLNAGGSPFSHCWRVHHLGHCIKRLCEAHATPVPATAAYRNWTDEAGGETLFWIHPTEREDLVFFQAKFFCQILQCPALFDYSVHHAHTNTHSHTHAHIHAHTHTQNQLGLTCDFFDTVPFLMQSKGAIQRRVARLQQRDECANAKGSEQGSLSRYSLQDPVRSPSQVFAEWA